jgi:hypothetical protein
VRRPWRSSFTTIGESRSGKSVRGSSAVDMGRMAELLVLAKDTRDGKDKKVFCL